MRHLDEATLERAATAVTAVDARIGEMFRRCFSDTLEHAIEILPDGTAFVVTGDIPAMWLRDSTAQLTPYLHFLRDDRALADLVEAVSRRQLAYLRHDPYANAFNAEDNGRGHQDDLSGQDGWAWERKFELDSIAYPIQLAHDLWQITGRTGHLDELVAATDVVLPVIETEQRHEELSTYRFRRPNAPASDTLVREGRGRRTNPNGLVWSGFRPSDDACEHGFHIPGNAFLSVALDDLARMLREVYGDEERAARAGALSRCIDGAIREHAIVDQPEHGPILAYEIDGFGAYVLMDDANVPSLLALPLLGWCHDDDPIYRSTRAFVLSDLDPYHFQGSAASGVGSAHTPAGMIWPIGLAVQGLTSTDPDEKLRLLRVIADTDGGTGMVHEAFDKDDAAVFTRPWFSWANAMFCELALEVAGLRTHRRQPLHSEVES